MSFSYRPRMLGSMFYSNSADKENTDKVIQLKVGSNASIISHENLAIGLTKQHELEIACEELGNFARTEALNHDDEKAVEKIIATLKATAAGLDSVIRETADPMLFTVRRYSNFPAGKVFAVPELLEQILSSLGTFDLLKMMTVSKAMKLAIDTSTRLKREMGLEAADSGSFVRLPLQYNPHARMAAFTPCPPRETETPGFSCFGSVHNQHGNLSPLAQQYLPDAPQDQHGHPPAPELEIITDFSLSDSGKLPIVGVRCRSILICQPPITTMEIVPSCCAMQMSDRTYHALVALQPAPPPGPHAEKIKITNPAGICVGDILDMARILFEKHRTCPNASDAMLYEDGNVRLYLHASGKALLQALDPYLVMEKRIQATNEERWEEGAKRTAKLKGLSEARKAARDAGESIPSLAQHLANKERSVGTSTSNDDDDDSHGY